MACPMISSHLLLSDLEMSNSRSLRFQTLKGAELDHFLLLDINRKAYMGSPVTLSRWVTLKGQIQGHSNFEALNLVKEQS